MGKIKRDSMNTRYIDFLSKIHAKWNSYHSDKFLVLREHLYVSEEKVSVDLRIKKFVVSNYGTQKTGWNETNIDYLWQLSIAK